MLDQVKVIFSDFLQLTQMQAANLLDDSDCLDHHITSALLIGHCFPVNDHPIAVIGLRNVA